MPCKLLGAQVWRRAQEAFLLGPCAAASNNCIVSVPWSIEAASSGMQIPNKMRKRVAYVTHIHTGQSWLSVQRTICFAHWNGCSSSWILLYTMTFLPKLPLGWYWTTLWGSTGRGLESRSLGCRMDKVSKSTTQQPWQGHVDYPIDPVELSTIGSITL